MSNDYATKILAIALQDETFAVLHAAVGTNLCFKLDYENAKGVESERVITSVNTHALTNGEVLPYATAWDFSNGELRTFNASRIVALAPELREDGTQKVANIPEGAFVYPRINALAKKGAVLVEEFTFTDDAGNEFQGAAAAEAAVKSGRWSMTPVFLTKKVSHFFARD